MSYTAEAANNGCCVISVILFDRAILHAIYLILFSALHNIRTKHELHSRDQQGTAVVLYVGDRIRKSPIHIAFKNMK